MKDRLLATGIILFFLFYWYFFWQVNHQEPPKGPTNFNDLFFPAEVRVGYEPEIIISGNCIIAVSPSVIPAREIRAVITKYTPRPEETQGDPYIMASNQMVYEGSIACPEWLEFGRLVEIDGKPYICGDRMNQRFRQGNFFDIFTFDLEEALEWGRQTRDIIVY